MDEYPVLIEEQKRLSAQVRIPPDRGYYPAQGDVILAMDIQYQGDIGHVAGDMHRWQGEHIGTYAGSAQITMPYVPSYFCFREGPPLLALIKKLEEEGLPKPDLVILDGHGIAHPRRFGVACWLGIALGKPTVGCAKEPLIHYEGELGDARGSTVDVLLENNVVGYVLRTQDKTRPVFVSPGNLVSLPESISIVLGLPGEYRVPDPLRNADHAARSHCKGLNEKEWKDVGELKAVFIDLEAH